MRKLTKLLSAILIAALACTMMIGCGGPKTTPEESAKIVLDIILKNDNSKIEEVGMTQDEFDQARNKIEGEFETQMKSAGGSLLSEESKKVLLDGMLAGMAKMEYTTELVSQDKKTAQVKVSIKPFDMTEVQNQLKDDLTKYYQANPSLTQQELFDYTFKKEAELLKAGTYKKEATTFTVTLSSNGKAWVPDESFMTSLGNSLVAY